MKSRSVSITGVTGFLGWHLAEAFRNENWRVRAIVRPGNRKAIPEGVESIEAALEPAAAAALARALEFSSLVIHSAGLTRARHGADLIRVNVEGTRALVGAANDAGAHLILVSSQAVIGPGTVARPSREDDQPRPVNAYGRSKLGAEEVVRLEARVPWTILRPCAVYGIRDRQFLPLFRMAKRGISVVASNPSTPFTLINVDDITRATLAAASNDRAVGQTMFLGHREPATTDDILRSLADVFGRRYRPWRLPDALLGLSARLGELAWMAGLQPVIDLQRLAELRAEGFVCSVDRARDVLGFTAAIGLKEGLERTASWYREHGLI